MAQRENPCAPSPYASSLEVQVFLVQFFRANNSRPNFGVQGAAKRASVLDANGESLYKMTREEFLLYFPDQGEVIYSIVQEGIWDYYRKVATENISDCLQSFYAWFPTVQPGSSGGSGGNSTGRQAGNQLLHKKRR